MTARRTYILNFGQNVWTITPTALTDLLAALYFLGADMNLDEIKFGLSSFNEIRVEYATSLKYTYKHSDNKSLAVYIFDLLKFNLTHSKRSWLSLLYNHIAAVYCDKLVDENSLGPSLRRHILIPANITEKWLRDVIQTTMTLLKKLEKQDINPASCLVEGFAAKEFWSFIPAEERQK